jgi:hypothetical protein
MKLSIIEIILLILFGISAVGNVFQAIFGIKIENNQTQIMQTTTLNVNENQNLNLVNDSIYFSNATVIADLGGGRTNLDFIIPLKMTNYTVKYSQLWAVTNQSNYTKVGLIPRK